MALITRASKYARSIFTPLSVSLSGRISFFLSRLVFLQLYILVMLTACSGDEPMSNTGENNPDLAVQFIPELHPQNELRFGNETTRAVDNTWTADDRVGIVMLESGTAWDASDTPSQYKTVKQGSIFTLQPTQPDQALYFPINPSKKVNFIAYYPFAELTNGKVTYPLANQSTQAKLEAADIMHAPRTEDYSKANTAVRLLFSHKLSKLVINVSTTADDTAVDLSMLEVKIDGTPGSVTLTPADGKIETADTPQTITACPVNRAPGTAEFHAIIAPHAAIPTSFVARKITFTDGSANTAEYWLPLDAVFTTNKAYEMNFSLTTDGVQAIKD